MITKGIRKSRALKQKVQIDFSKLHEHWQFCPEENLTNLFYYGGENENFKAQTYELGSVPLNEMLSSCQSSPINIRIYMGAQNNIPYGAITTSPSFVPIVQAFNTSSGSGDISRNAFLSHFINERVSSIPISEAEAAKMKLDWKEFFKGDMIQLFESQGVRVNFMTFDNSDSEKIRAFTQRFAARQPVLLLHMGFEIPTDAMRPFGFRIVLEVTVDELNNPDRPRAFFEFSNPCPPAC